MAGGDVSWMATGGVVAATQRRHRLRTEAVDLEIASVDLWGRNDDGVSWGGTKESLSVRRIVSTEGRVCGLSLPDRVCGVLSLSNKGCVLSLPDRVWLSVSPENGMALPIECGCQSIHRMEWFSQ